MPGNLCFTSFPGGSGACWSWEWQAYWELYIFRSLIKGIYIPALRELRSHLGFIQTRNGSMWGYSLALIDSIKSWGGGMLGKLESGWPWRVGEMELSFRNHFSSRSWGNLLSKLHPVPSRWLSQRRAPQIRLPYVWKVAGRLGERQVVLLNGKESIWSSTLLSILGGEVPRALRSGQDWDPQGPGGAGLWCCVATGCGG